jgi:hypothetical protein
VELQQMPFHIEVASPYGWGYDRIYEAAHDLKKEYNDVLVSEDGIPKQPFLMVLDFLQIVTSPQGVREDLRNRIQQAAYAARAVARDLDGAVLCISSAARDNYSILEGGTKKKPWNEPPFKLVGLGKESGEVEYSADSVSVLVREPWPDGLPPARGTVMHLAVAKQRAGEVGWLDYRFNYCRFVEEPSGDDSPRSENTVDATTAAERQALADQVFDEDVGA